MHTIKTTCRAFATIALGLFFSSSLVCKAQEQTHLAGKEAPAQIRHELVILGDDVVQEEWAASLGLVNAPEDLQQIEPGQCIRFGVIATGNGRDVLLRSATFSFELHLGGEVRTFAAEPAVVIKQVKPEGGDFVTQALGAAGVKNPSLSMVSLAASIPRWCLSADVHAESAKVLAKAFLKSGKTVSLNSRVLRLKTFEGARKAHPFTSLDMLDRWVQSYYRAPDPAQLLPGLRIVAADPTARSMHNIMVFFIAAMKKRPEAADDIMRHLPNESAVTRMYALPLVQRAGYEIEPLLRGLEPDEIASLKSMKIPDPFEINPDQALPDKMDMLWAIFFATGQIRPVKKIASMLAWRHDYDMFVDMRKSGQRPAELTASIMRGIVYAAAGWSLNELSRSDRLVADYVEALRESPDTPAAVKNELASLYTNPAFKKD